MAEKTRFRQVGICGNYIFPNGKVAEFKSGVYETVIKSEIEHLSAEIENGLEHYMLDTEDYSPPVSTPNTGDMGKTENAPAVKATSTAALAAISGIKKA